LEVELAMTREELRLVGVRMKRIAPHRRPQYTQVERMAILELRAMRGWNKAETARHFFVSDDTIRAWLGRTDDDSLVQTRTPVNRFPDFVRYVVQQIKLFCPTLGKAKIADKLARASIHMGKTTVQRILKEKPAEPSGPTAENTGKQCRIVSKYPSHTWHADLTAVPISGGFWTNWLPNAIWQRWPVCWWVLNVVDHYSRRCMGFAVFKNKPSSEEVTTALTRIMFAKRRECRGSAGSSAIPLRALASSFPCSRPNCQRPSRMSRCFKWSTTEFLPRNPVYGHPRRNSLGHYSR
jgi:hypothetical protein